MKRGLRWLPALFLVTLLAAVVYVCSFRLCCDDTLHAAAKQGDSLSWLRSEYHLTDAQFEAIRTLHTSYTGTCEEHCRNIQEAIRTRDALRALSPADSVAVAAADKRITLLSTECEDAISQHLVRVAELMSPEDGQRYLATMRPLLARFHHTGAPDLGFTNVPQPHEH